MHLDCHYNIFMAICVCPLQETCLSSGCTVGTYSSVLTIPIGDLGPGADVCIPCDPLCKDCVRPGTRLADCTVCTFAASTTEGCVESCNATSGEELEVLSDCMGFVVDYVSSHHGSCGGLPSPCRVLCSCQLFLSSVCKCLPRLFWSCLHRLSPVRPGVCEEIQ